MKNRLVLINLESSRIFFLRPPIHPTCPPSPRGVLGWGQPHLIFLVKSGTISNSKIDKYESRIGLYSFMKVTFLRALINPAQFTRKI